MGAAPSTESIIQPQDVDQSSGFHIIEIHVGTARLGGVILVILALIAICIYRKCRRHQRKSRQQCTIPPWPNHGYPLIVTRHQIPRQVSPLTEDRFQDITNKETAPTPNQQTSEFSWENV